MGDLSPHFSRSEAACPHCGAGTFSPQILAILENLRHLAGDKPLTVRSGFRCVPHNADVGGAKDSRHIHGDACDLEPNMYTIAQCEQAGAVGIGFEGNFATHIDWRPGGRVTFKD